MLDITTLKLFCEDCNADVEARHENRTGIPENVEDMDFHCPQGHLVKYQPVP